MGRKLVEATNAWSIRRTRGETGRFRLFALAERILPPFFLLAVLTWPDVFVLEADAALLVDWEDFALVDGT